MYILTLVSTFDDIKIKLSFKQSRNFSFEITVFLNKAFLRKTIVYLYRWNGNRYKLRCEIYFKSF